MASIPAFLRSEEQPPVAAYHPAPGSHDPTRCLGRRTDDDHADRRWNYAVYGSYQCKSRPVAGSDLCTTCQRREAAGATTKKWHGRMTDAELPAYSHCAGSVWFHTKAEWTGVEKPLTRRMEERAPERRLISDVELRRFADGKVRLDIKRLTEDNQITGQQLRDMVCRIAGRPEGADRINGHGSKPELAALVCALVDPTVTVKPKFSIHYPAADAPASGGAGSAAGSVASSAESEEAEALKAENAALKAELAALKAKMAAAAAALSDD